MLGCSIPASMYISRCIAINWDFRVNNFFSYDFSATMYPLALWVHFLIAAKVPWPICSFVMKSVVKLKTGSFPLDLSSLTIVKNFYLAKTYFLSSSNLVGFFSSFVFNNVFWVYGACIISGIWAVLFCLCAFKGLFFKSMELSSCSNFSATIFFINGVVAFIWSFFLGGVYNLWSYWSYSNLSATIFFINGVVGFIWSYFLGGVSSL